MAEIGEEIEEFKKRRLVKNEQIKIIEKVEKEKENDWEKKEQKNFFREEVEGRRLEEKEINETLEQDKRNF